MNANLPKYMSIKDFCSYSGFSRYQFMRLAFKANITIKYIGFETNSDWRSKMVDVQAALAAIEALPDADKEVPVNLQTAPSTAQNCAVEDVVESTEVEAASTWPNGQVEDVAETTSAAE
jgi:hypothetical protein